MRKVMPFISIAALAVAGLLGATGSASADGDATIEIHVRCCPPGAVDVFADCHDKPFEDLLVYIEIDGGASMATGVVETPTDDHGNAVFDVDAAEGPFYWEWNGSDDFAPRWPDDYVTSYCSLEGGDGSNIQDATWQVEVEAGDYVVCDIYFWNWEMDPIHGGAETPNTGAGPMTTGTSAGFFLAGAVALGGLAMASRKRAFR